MDSRSWLSSRTWSHKRVLLVVGSLVLLWTLGVTFASGFYLFNRQLQHLAKNWLAQAKQPAVAAAAPQGWWQRYANSADGYSLALPPGWQAVPLDQASLERYAQQSGSAEALMAQRLAVRAQERRATGAGIWAALAPDPAPEGVTSLNIVRQPLGQEMAVDSFARASMDSLKHSGNAPLALRQTKIKLPSGQALRVEMTYRLDPEQKGSALHVTQFYLVKGTNGYVVTAVTRASQAAANAPVFDGVMQSMRWTS
jgi:hypothetical protein